MTLLADLATAADSRESEAETPPRRRVPRPRPRRGGSARGASVLTPRDLRRLAGTLAVVGAAVSALSLVASGGSDSDLQRVLHTPYGLVALGQVRTDGAVPDLLRGAASALDRPAAEQRLIVPVTLHNLSDEPVHYGPEHFRLDVGGSASRPEAGSSPSGEVAPGGAVQLRLVFDVRSAASARLTVDDARPAAGRQLRLPPAVAAPATP